MGKTPLTILRPPQAAGTTNSQHWVGTHECKNKINRNVHHLLGKFLGLFRWEQTYLPTTTESYRVYIETSNKKADIKPFKTTA